MIKNKEFYEILNISKAIVKLGDCEINCEINESSFNQEYLKKFLNSNPQIVKLIDLLKEKNKVTYSQSRNFFNIVNNNNKKIQKDNKIIIATLNTFTLCYNEPKYIETLNRNICEKIKELLMSSFSKSTLISISNGKSNEIDETLSKNPISPINGQFIIDEIYKVKNDNLLYVENEKFQFRLSKHALLTLIEKYEHIIINFSENLNDMQTRRKIEQIEKMLTTRNKAELIDFMGKGLLPNSIRQKVYYFLLELNNDSYFSKTAKVSNLFIENYDNLLLSDIMVMTDSEEILKNEHYFLFIDVIKKILLRFFRDERILAEVQDVHPVIAIGLSSNKNLVPFTPSSLIPYHGICLIVAPFCFMTTNLDELYIIFKAFYCRFLASLYSFSSNPNSALHLIYNFDNLFTNWLPDIKEIIKTHGIDMNQVVIEWYFKCFSDLICPLEIYKIYDAILVTGSTQILILISLALIWHKKANIIKSTTKAEVLSTLRNYKFEDFEIFVLTKRFVEHIRERMEKPEEETAKIN